MTNTEIICSALGKPNILDNIKELKEEKCFLCGKSITEGTHIKNVFSGNFTNFDVCENLNGEYFCKECAYCLKDANLRKNNVIADKDNIYLLKKNDLEEYLFNLNKYVKDKFIVCITQSFKKHNVIRAKINTNTNNFYIRLEDNEFLFNASELKPIYDKLNDAYLTFSKEELETGDYKSISVEKFGLKKFIEYEGTFKQYRGSSQFELLIYMLNSERRNEIVKERNKLEKEEKARIKKLEKEKKNAKK